MRRRERESSVFSLLINSVPTRNENRSDHVRGTRVKIRYKISQKGSSPKIYFKEFSSLSRAHKTGPAWFSRGFRSRATLCAFRRRRGMGGEGRIHQDSASVHRERILKCVPPFLRAIPKVCEISYTQLSRDAHPGCTGL